MRREQRDRKMDVNVVAVFFSLKPPQTYDNFMATRENRRRRVTKKKLDFSRWIFWSDENVKIILGFIDVFEFLSISKNGFCCFERSKKMAFACIYNALCAERKNGKIERRWTSCSEWFFLVHFKSVKKPWEFIGKSEHVERRSKK